MTKTMKKNWKIIIGLFFVWIPAVLSAHGIKLNIEKFTPFIQAKAYYHGSQALSHAQVTVTLKEGNSDTPFQKGQTDRNGYFCFLPDRPGQWTIIVDDMLGHRGHQVVEIETGFFPVPPAGNSTGPTTLTSEPPRPISQPKKVEEPGTTTPTPLTTTPSTINDNGDNETCCYIMKIMIGVFLILLLTVGVYYLKKHREKKSNS